MIELRWCNIWEDLVVTFQFIVILFAIFRFVENLNDNLFVGNKKKGHPKLHNAVLVLRFLALVAFWTLWTIINVVARLELVECRSLVTSWRMHYLVALLPYLNLWLFLVILYSNIQVLFGVAILGEKLTNFQKALYLLVFVGIPGIGAFVSYFFWPSVEIMYACKLSILLSRAITSRRFQNILRSSIRMTPIDTLKPASKVKVTANAKLTGALIKSYRESLSVGFSFVVCCAILTFHIGKWQFINILRMMQLVQIDYFTTCLFLSFNLQGLWPTLFGASCCFAEHRLKLHLPSWRRAAESAEVSLDSLGKIENYEEEEMIELMSHPDPEEPTFQSKHKHDDSQISV